MNAIRLALVLTVALAAVLPASAKEHRILTIKQPARIAVLPTSSHPCNEKAEQAKIELAPSLSDPTWEWGGQYGYDYAF